MILIVERGVPSRIEMVISCPSTNCSAINGLPHKSDFIAMAASSFVLQIANPTLDPSSTGFKTNGNSRVRSAGLMTRSHCGVGTPCSLATIFAICLSIANLEGLLAEPTKGIPDSSRHSCRGPPSPYGP